MKLNALSLRHVFLGLIALAFGLLGLNGCGGGWGEFKPTITTQVQSQTVTAGQTVKFTVAATGTGPITYQWSRNGQAVAGSTGTTLSWVAQASDNGTVVMAAATNAGGTSTSSGTLTVEAPPVIVTQPLSQTVNAGGTMTFSVTASGTAPLSYQWSRNGTPIAGANGTSYTTSALGVADSGASFTVAVANAVGTVTSAPAIATVTPLTPSLAFAPVSALTYGATPFPVAATSASTGAVTYTVISGPATISGNTVTITGAGTIVVGATQAAAGNYGSASAQISITVGPETPTLTFSPVGAQIFGGVPFTVSASSASSGAITYAVVSGPATVVGNLVTLTGSGTVVLSASQAAAGNYASATAQTTINAGVETPKLSFAPLGTQTVGTPFAVSATSASPGAITYSVISGPATISGNMVTASAAGAVVIGASQAASGNYGQATAQASVTAISNITPTLTFAPVPAQTYGNAPFTVSASSASSGAIVYSVISGPATIVGNLVTPTGAGTIVLGATQAAAGSYTAASAQVSVPVAAATPTLTFAPIAPPAVGSPFTVTATSASPGAITYSVVSGPATIAGNSVTITGTGTVVIGATQAAAGNYAAGSAQTTVTGSTSTPALTFAPIPPETYGNAPFTVSATSASSGAITYTVVSGPATISGNTVTLTGSGTVVLSATQAAAGAYGSATVQTTITVGAATPTLSFAPIPAQSAGNPPFTVSATSASSGAVTYTVVSGPATIANNTVTITGAGTIVLGASQAAAGNYSAATAQTSVAVSASPTPTLTFAVGNQTFGAAPFPVNATSPSTGAITYSVASGPATIAGNVVSLTGTGTVVLSASQAAAGNYGAATTTASFTVAPEVPNLVFASIAPQVFGNAPFQVSATSASSGTVTYNVISGPATIVGNMVTITGAGTVTLGASQAAAGNYAVGSATTSVVIGAETPNLTFTPIATQTYGEAAFTVSATSASNGAVTYAVVSGPASINGNLVTLTGTGTVVLSASQAPSGSYGNAVATTNFLVNANPTIIFNSATETYSTTPFTVSATSNSTGAITYAIVSGPGTLNGNAVTMTGAGPIVVSATQAAAGGYSAGSAQATFTVNAIAPTINFTGANETYSSTTPFTVAATSNSTGAFTYAIVSGPGTLNGNAVTMTGSGPIVVSATQAAAGGYSAGSAQATFTVNAIAPTITFTGANETYSTTPFTVAATSNSTGAITYAIVSGPGTISGNAVTMTGAGPIVVSATQAAAGGYSAGSAQATFTVNAIAPTITFTGANETYSATPFTVAATSNSTGAITYAIVSGPGTLNGNAVTMTGAGPIVVSATQAAAGGYSAGSAQATFTVNAIAPTINFTGANETYSSTTPFTVAATSNSTGAFTYAIVSGPGTLNGNAVTMTGSGPIVVSATQAAAGGYSAGSAQATFTVNAIAPTITFTGANETYSTTPFTVAATSNSTGAITYAIVSGPGTISGNAVTMTGAGPIVVSATQAAAGGYSAGSAQATFTVNAIAPTITFTGANETYSATPFTVAATSNSTGAITYAIVSGPGTLNGNAVTMTGAGPIVVSATQAAAGGYSAGSAQATFTVNAIAPTINFTGANETYSSTTPFTVAATSNSTGAFTYAIVSGPGTLNGNAVTMTGAGPIVVSATQAAAGGYSAGSAQATFTVSAIAPTITFTGANETYSTTPFTVAATSNSTGAITYAIVSGPGTISGNAVTMTGAGPIVVSATQAAAGGYSAGSAQATFTVAPNVSITPITPANTTVAPGVVTFNATATGGYTNKLNWSASGGSFTNNVWTSPNAAGTYTITATSADQPNVFVTTTITVSAPVITTQPASQNVCTNAATTLSVSANYASGYQWYEGTTLIAGATSTNYLISSAQPSLDAGSYHVVVSNPAGSVTSNVVSVGVGSSITTQPLSISTFVGNLAVFSVSVSGEGPFTYQWYVSANSGTGTAIAGATASVLSLPSVIAGNNGSQYYVIITDGCGNQLISARATLTVNSGFSSPSITLQPVNAIVGLNGTTTFVVAAVGSPTLNYQWYVVPAGSTQGTANAIAGANLPTYVVPATATNASNDQDQYYVVVTNSGINSQGQTVTGQAVSNHATLTVGSGISISRQPQTQYVSEGDNATYSVTASSLVPLTYQWYSAAPGLSTFAAIPGATSSTLTVSSTTTAETATVYYVVVSNGLTAPVTSSSASLFVGALANIPLCSPNWATVGNTTNINSCSYQLTPATNNQEGNIVWPTLISTGDIQISFTVATSNASNPVADGFTLLLGDPSLGATPTSQGAVGQGLGAEGIPGFVLAFDDYENAGDPPVPYLGVGRGETALWEKPYEYVNSNIPALAVPAISGNSEVTTHSYTVSLYEGFMTVTMDGTVVFSGQVSVPPVAYLYFTSSTGGFYEQTVVSNVSATVSAPSN